MITRTTTKGAPFEPLERRAMFSAGLLPAQRTPVEAGFAPITWAGQETYARPGQWVARLTASVARRSSSSPTLTRGSRAKQA